MGAGITLERPCCSFLAFRLDWSERDGVLLRLTGGPGVKAFLGTRLSRTARTAEHRHALETLVTERSESMG